MKKYTRLYLKYITAYGDKFLLSEKKMSKKMRGDDVEYVIAFDQTHSFRTLVDVIRDILNRVVFRVKKCTTRENTFFLCIDTVDQNHVCMILARLTCERFEGLEGDESFCVDTTILNTLIRNVPAHYSMELMKRKDSSDICIRTYESLSNSHETHYTLSTLVDDSDTIQLNDIAYKYTVEIDLGTLRQIVKMSQALKAENIELSVSESKSGANRTLFSLTSRGDAIQEHRFNSSSVSEGDSYVIRAATDTTGPEDGGALEEKYKGTFSTQYMGYFLKSMERQMLTMKLSDDKPLILHYPLDAEMSYICFVLAPKTDE